MTRESHRENLVRPTTMDAGLSGRDSTTDVWWCVVQLLRCTRGASCPVRPSTVRLVLLLALLSVTVAKTDPWKDPEKGIGLVCDGGLQKNKRTQCQKIYIYIETRAVYKKQMEVCKKYNAKIATLRFANESYWASKHPFHYGTTSYGIQYYVGARRTTIDRVRGKVLFRWHDGPIVGVWDNLKDEMWNEGTIRAVDEDNLNLCLTLTDDATFKAFSCNNMFGAICEKCVVPVIPKSLCNGYCVKPGGRFSCKSYIEKCRETDDVAARATPLCDTLPCPRNRWGDRCERLCMCRDDQECHLLTGRCPGKCQMNWAGQACNITICKPRRWHTDCSRLCFCADSQACDVNAGDCHNGCMAGTQGISCDKTFCPNGQFGDGCQKLCHCKKINNEKVPCSKVDGICLTTGITTDHSCEPGWFGIGCNETVCPSGYYNSKGGGQCDAVCKCDFYGGCDINGRCPGNRCQPGWESEQNGDSDCGKSKFGNEFCNSTCQSSRREIPLTQCNCSYRTDFAMNDTSFTHLNEKYVDGCEPYTGQCLTTHRIEAFKKRLSLVCSPDKVSEEHQHPQERAHTGRYGVNCDKKCKQVNCEKCDRWGGDLCFQCSKDYEINVTSKRCIESCEEISGMTGSDCGERCADNQCLQCLRTNKYHCLICYHKFSKNANNSLQCIDESIVLHNEYALAEQDEHEFNEAEYTIQYFVVLCIIQTVMCLCCFSICRCHRFNDISEFQNDSNEPRDKRRRHNNSRRASRSSRYSMHQSQDTSVHVHWK